MMLWRVFSSILYVVFPPLCVSCGRAQNDFKVKVCDDCWNSLRRLSSLVLENKVYVDYLDELVAVFVFDDAFQRIVHAMKYSGFRSVAYELGCRVGEELKGVEQVLECDLIIPIPLNSVKKRERGYNQCELLAVGVSSKLYIGVEDKVLKRRKYTVSQTNLGVEERKKNVEDAFLVECGEMAVRGKKIILLDDVVTTGATLNFAAKTLKDAGAEKVIGVAAATPIID